jgi:MFS family permease
VQNVADAVHATSSASVWIVSSYLLANAVCQPVMAALADIFGRQWLYFAAVVTFATGSIICSAAETIATLLAGRTIQGVGGGTILCLNLIIVADLVPLRQRGAYTGILQLVFGLGLTIAPLIGAGLVKATWRWLFYINLPFCGIGLLVVPFALRYQRAKTTFYTKLLTIDWIGSMLCIASCSLFLVGLAWGGVDFAWTSPGTLVPICLGIAGTLATGLYERYVARLPFLRLSLFRSFSAIAAYTCTLLQSVIVC